MTNDNVRDSFDAMQRAFNATWPQFGKLTAHNAETFWKNQEKVLNSLHEFTQGWFDRRREATKTALEAAQSIATSTSPADMVQECHAWMMRSAERMMADGAGCQKHLMNVVDAVAAQIPEEVAQMKSGVAQAVRASERAARAEAA